MKVIATNKRALRGYEAVETYEAGLVLSGSEVKSLRAGRAELKDSYAIVSEGEAWLVGMHIAPYSFARDGGHEPERTRKLLLHKREIRRIGGLLSEKGLTLVPSRLVLKDGVVKLELVLGRGRAKYDKRRALQEEEQRREMEQALRRR